MIFNHCSKKDYWPFEWFSKSSFIRSLPISQAVLDVSQMAIAFHRIKTTIFHPILSVTLLQHLPSLVERLFQQCHVSRIDGVLKCDDSMISLHKICQIPRIVRFNDFRLFGRLEKLSWTSFHLLRGFVPRLSTGDCSVIHLPRGGLCDQPLSSHRASLHEEKLRQCVFCKEPLSFWFSSRRRNSRPLGKWV